MRSFVAALILLSCTWIAPRAWAQVTTANVRGAVQSADDKLPMAEVEVTLIHVPSGNVQTTNTNSDGNYAFTNLRVGGPYVVRVEVVGFQPVLIENIFLSAGKTRDIPIGLRLQTEVIEVKGAPVPRNTSSRTTVSAAEIDSLPSVGRDPRDVVRRNPEASVEGADRALSIGGANTRYNSITVDGVRQDDDFGLNQSGYPTRRSPIALSAIEELTVETSPFDVRYNKFLGGNVNIVTKSGTNDFKGQLIGTYSSDALLGSKVRDQELKLDFSEVRYGATVGGPILKDKLHFLASVEGLTATRPIDAGPAGSGAANITSRVSQADMERVQQIARDVYGFDAGQPSRNLDEADLKLLGKLDWAIDKNHRASVIYQRTGGNQIQPTTATDISLPLSSNWYDAADVLHSFSGRVFSNWSDKLSTQLEVSGKLVSSRVNPLNGNGFMQATITVPNDPSTTTDDGRIVLGPDEFRHKNELDNDVLHGKAEANYLTGPHLVTGGLEYERLFIRNLFVPASNGVAQYASLDAFEMRTPSSLRYSNAVTLNPKDGEANWSAGTTMMYLQDQFKLTSELTVQGGLRFEIYDSSGTIADNENFYDRYKFSNTSTLSGRHILMPRLGISYLPFDQLNVRAGVGLYSGGTPTVWMSNSYSNDGVRISSRTLNASAQNSPIINGFDGREIPQALKDMIAAGDGSVDALDPNFKIPSVWKAGTGADYAFDIPGLGAQGKNAELKLNYTFSKAQNAVLWQDLRRNSSRLPGATGDNNVPVGVLPDGRTRYGNGFVTGRGVDMLLTNTTRGYGHVASVVLQKGFPFGLFVSGSYAWQDVYEVNPGTSSRSVSNYGLIAVSDPDHPALAVSNYERKHRLTAAVEFSRALVGDVTKSRPWKDMKTSVGLFVESRSGQPFSYTFADASNGTTLSRLFGEELQFASRNRQLFYVPKGDGSDVTLMGIDPAEFDAFLRRTGLDKYRGQIAPRNAFRSPWIHRFDLRISQDLPNPIKGQRARLMLDIENLGNLLSSNWGRQQAVPFPYVVPAVEVSYDAAQGKYIYQGLRQGSPYRVDVLASVWRMSLGLIYDF
ncbi:MAG TPA: TonB-dependent receptor [Kofleriaceae bacterium]|nr:TonB-dependent receptor [Kofleriaceae bacterium]